MRLGCAISTWFLSLAGIASAETTYLFEVPGEFQSIGSWTIVIQEDGAVMVMGGESRFRRFPNVLETAADPASIQIICNSEVISMDAILPGRELLQTGIVDGALGLYTLWLDRVAIGQREVSDSEAIFVDNRIVVPILNTSPENPDLDRILNASEISVRVASLSITTGMITATYATSQTRDAFSTFLSACDPE